MVESGTKLLGVEERRVGNDLYKIFISICFAQITQNTISWKTTYHQFILIDEIPGWPTINTCHFWVLRGTSLHFLIIDGRVFFRIFTFSFIFNNDWVRMYKYTKIKGLNSSKITSLPETKTWWTWRVILIFTENKRYAKYKVHLHTMKVFHYSTSL